MVCRFGRWSPEMGTGVEVGDTTEKHDRLQKQYKRVCIRQWVSDEYILRCEILWVSRDIGLRQVRATYDVYMKWNSRLVQSQHKATGVLSRYLFRPLRAAIRQQIRYGRT